MLTCLLYSIYITSSGDFCTPVLKFVGEQLGEYIARKGTTRLYTDLITTLGYDRLMFSLD